MESQTPELPPLDHRRSVTLEAMRYVMSWPASYIKEYTQAAIAAAVQKERADAERYRELLYRIYVDPEQFILRISGVFLLADGGTLQDRITAAIDAAIRARGEGTA